jgi:uncharacterized protein with FMN-binding domain
MKKLLSLAITSALFLAFAPEEPVIRQKDGMVLINTTTLCAKYDGYNGPTPLVIYLKDKKVVKVEALPNKETPQYFLLLEDEKFFSRWNGLTASEAAELEVDTVSGATWSSDAVIHNVRKGLIYYLENGK